MLPLWRLRTNAPWLAVRAVQARSQLAAKEPPNPKRNSAKNDHSQPSGNLWILATALHLVDEV